MNLLTALLIIAALAGIIATLFGYLWLCFSKLPIYIGAPLLFFTFLFIWAGNVSWKEYKEELLKSENRARNTSREETDSYPVI